MFTTQPSQVNARTKAFVAAAFAWLMAVNVPEVRNYVIPKLSQHPRIAATVSGVLAIIAALHNPAVRQILGMKSEASLEQMPDGQTKLVQNTEVVLPDNLSDTPPSTK